MAITLEEIMVKISKERQQQILARAEELKLEEESLTSNNFFEIKS